MKITISSGDKQSVVSSEERILLSEAIQSGSFPFDMPCNGRGVCGKCRVYASGCLSAPTRQETEHLGAELADGMRLACMTWAEGDCEVRLLQKNAHIVTDSVAARLDYAPMGKNYGFAVDIGTTTVAIYLCDFRNQGKQIAQAAFSNPQSAFGADVISRIQEALDGGAERLSQVIRERLEETFLQLCGQAGISSDLVDSIVITGNTTMLYLLCQVDTEPLSHSPFAITEYFGRIVDDSMLRFGALKNARVFLPRTISAFVGSDITCSILTSGIRQKKGINVMADIGTNGEMAVYRDGKLCCCSTAAGPAFEGAGITMGSAAIDGAISDVTFDHGFTYKTIGGQKKATGICGSGLIDAVAACLHAGLVDETGRIDEDTEENLPFLTEYQGKQAVKIGESGVVLTQEDFRAVQLAKAAICAGIRSLMHEVGVEAGEVDHLFLAGGFGSFIKPESAAAIGLIPGELASRLKSIGNAALGGAYAILCSEAEHRESDDIAKSAVNLELSSSPYFMDQYVEEMMFPVSMD